MSKYLIQEITEARIFYKDSKVDGKSAKWLAELAFTMIMALEIMRHTRERLAKNYAGATLRYQEFDAMYSNASDLYNILVVLNNQDDFSEYIIADTSIHFPKLQFKRYLRDIIGNNPDPAADRTLFLKLESNFKVDDSYLKIVRRTVANWSQASFAEKHHAKALLDTKLRTLAQYIDLNLMFNDIHIEQ